MLTAMAAAIHTVTKKERLLVVFIFFSSCVQQRFLLARPLKRLHRFQDLESSEARQPLLVERCCAFLAAERNLAFSVFHAREPMLVSDGFFAHKTLTVPVGEAAGIIVTHVIFFRFSVFFGWQKSGAGACFHLLGFPRFTNSN